jgi:signal peptidase II
MLKRYKIILSIFIPYVLDQVSKFLIYKNFFLYEKKVIINGLFNIRYNKNYGAAFSFLNDSPVWFRKPFFIIVPTAAIIFVIYLLIKNTKDSLLKLYAFSFIIAGALGNLTDRFTYGYVIDFIDVHIKTYHWPTFNIADISIFIAIVLLIIDEIKNKEKKN